MTWSLESKHFSYSQMLKRTLSLPTFLTSILLLRSLVPRS